MEATFELPRFDFVKVLLDEKFHIMLPLEKHFDTTGTNLSPSELPAFNRDPRHLHVCFKIEFMMKPGSFKIKVEHYYMLPGFC